MVILIQLVVIAALVLVLKVGWRMGSRGIDLARTPYVPEGFESIEDYDNFLDHYAGEFGEAF